MANSVEEAFGPVLRAASFAARAHRFQLRKDRDTPYVSHPFRVCLIARHVFGIEDAHVLMTALLHDTVEDTTTDFDDVQEQFGDEVAQWVGLLTKDKRSPEPAREQSYADRLRSAPWQVKVCKLADMLDNLMDMGQFSPEKKVQAFKKHHLYLDALNDNLAPQARPAWELVSNFLLAMEARQAGQSGGA